MLKLLDKNTLMKNNTHTPGPWTMDKLGSKNYYFEIHAKGKWIADVKGPSQNEQSEANARLIASAPELLEALQELLNVDHNAVDIQARINAEHKAKQAINKATN